MPETAPIRSQPELSWAQERSCSTWLGSPKPNRVQGCPRRLEDSPVTQLGSKADKIGKDDNYRGIAVFNNVLYFTKGSGSNGVNTVYFVDTAGTACPKTGIGIPQSGATLPTTSIPYDLPHL